MRVVGGSRKGVRRRVYLPEWLPDLQTTHDISSNILLPIELHLRKSNSFHNDLHVLLHGHPEV